MILPGCEDPRNCMDPQGVSEGAGEITRCERWSVYFIVRYDGMRSDDM